MVIESVTPSTRINETLPEQNQMSIEWKATLPKADILKVLEKEFYPFKKVSLVFII